MSAEVQGVEQLHRLGQGLRAFDDRKFKNSVSKRLRDVVKPSGEQAKLNAHEVLPHRGHLDHMVDGARVSARTVTSGRAVGISVTMTQKKSGGRQRDLVNLDAGRVRHPVFADPTKPRKEWTWVNQTVQSGFFTRAMQDQERAVQTALLRVLDDVTKQVESYLN